MHQSNAYLSHLLISAKYRMKAAQRLIRIFSELQNTASAAYFAYRCTLVYPYRYPPDTPEICVLKNECNAELYYRLRHPNLSVLDTWNTKEPSLQVRGIWTKLKQHSRFCPPKKCYCSSWMWRSQIYIAFGTTQKKLTGDDDVW